MHTIKMWKKRRIIKTKKRIWKNILVISLFSIYVIIVYYLNNDNSDIDKIDFDLVLPIGQQHADLFNHHKKFYNKYLNHKNIIIISKSDNFHLFEKDESVILIDEDTLLQKEQINKFLKEKRSITTQRDFWYEQQFLKMSYARICKKEYYLIWDSDTVPIKSIQMFENSKPFFDMITHYHHPYFKTLNLILPGLKLANLSFISEHIMVKTEYMKNLLDEIERNDKLEGKFFWEKIMMAIDLRDIHGSGFSEFETYGTFVNTRYPNSYIYRKYMTLKVARYFYDSVDNLNESDINWLSQDFYSVSFERYEPFEKDNFEIVKNSELQKKYKPLELFNNFTSIKMKYKKN